MLNQRIVKIEHTKQLTEYIESAQRHSLTNTTFLGSIRATVDSINLSIKHILNENNLIIKYQALGLSQKSNSGFKQILYYTKNLRTNQ